MFTDIVQIKMASALPNDGEVHTFELAENHIRIASKFLMILHTKTSQFMKVKLLKI